MLFDKKEDQANLPVSCLLVCLLVKQGPPLTWSVHLSDVFDRLTKAKVAVKVVDHGRSNNTRNCCYESADLCSALLVMDVPRNTRTHISAEREPRQPVHLCQSQVRHLTSWRPMDFVRNSHIKYLLMFPAFCRYLRRQTTEQPHERLYRESMA